MIKIDPTILVILGEVIVGLVVIIIAALIYFFKHRKGDKQAVEALQTRLKNNSDKRKKLFEEVLAKTGDGEVDSEDMVAEKKEMALNWVDKENKFYKRLVEMYMQRDSSTMRSLDKLLHEYTSSYLDVVAMMRKRVDSEQSGLSEELRQQLERLEQGGHNLASEIESLKAENQRLSHELEKANAEIDQAMNEYSLAFRPGSGMTGSAGTPPTTPAPTVSEPASEGSDTVVSEQAESTLPKSDSGPEGKLHEVELGIPDSADTEIIGDAAALEDDSLLEGLSEDLVAELSAEPVNEQNTAELEDLHDTELRETAAGETVQETMPEMIEKTQQTGSDAELAVDVEDSVVVVQEDEPLPGVGGETLSLETESVAKESVSDSLAEDEEASLEDVVLHAMAEESALKSAAESESVEQGMVIDLSKDEDVVLSAMGDALPEDADMPENELPESLSDDQAEADLSDIDEDALLAQLDSIEDDDDFLNELKGLGELPEATDEAETKK